MKIDYFKQKSTESFRIENKINVSVNNIEGRQTIQIYPFTVKFNNNTLKFQGISGINIDLSDSEYVIIGRPDSENNVILALYRIDLFQDVREVHNGLGILIYISSEKIVILDHSWEV